MFFIYYYYKDINWSLIKLKNSEYKPIILHPEYEVMICDKVEKIFNFEEKIKVEQFNKKVKNLYAIYLTNATQV